MVDSCSRGNGILYIVARSWLLFLHDESKWKISNQILLEVLMNCTKHFDLSSSLMASCVARFMICWVCRPYFSGLVCSVLSLDECLIKINYGRFCVCFWCLEKVILCRRWPRINSDTIVSMFNWFCHMREALGLTGNRKTVEKIIQNRKTETKSSIKTENRMKNFQNR